MSIPTPQTVELMSIAATMRAAGYSWESIAPKVRRSARTCKRWPLIYAKVWDGFFFPASRQVAIELGSQARLALKRALVSKNEKIMQDTGKFLARRLEKAEDAFERKMEQTDPQANKDEDYTAILETLDENQRRALIEEYVNQRLAELAAAQHGRENSASPAVGE